MSRLVTSVIEQVTAPVLGQFMSIADINARLEEINRETWAIVPRAAAVTAGRRLRTP